jgi:hypothetical protein
MGRLRTPICVQKYPQNCKGSTNKKFIVLLCRFLIFLVRVLFAVKLSVLAWITLYFQILAPIYAISTEIIMKNTSI